jgi:hypothetical protein
MSPNYAWAEKRGKNGSYKLIKKVALLYTKDVIVAEDDEDGEH